MKMENLQGQGAYSEEDGKKGRKNPRRPLTTDAICEALTYTWGTHWGLEGEGARESQNPLSKWKRMGAELANNGEEVKSLPTSQRFGESMVGESGSEAATVAGNCSTTQSTRRREMCRGAAGGENWPDLR